MRWSVGYPAQLTHSLAREHPTFDQLLVEAIALVAWALLGWATVVLTVEVAAVLPGACGRQSSRLARAVTPAAVRRLAQGAIGLTVLVGPMTAGRALAAGADPSPPVTSNSAPLLSLDRPLPHRQLTVNLDRPAIPATTLPSPSVGSPATPPILPRAQPHSPSTAALAAGAPQREASSLAYVVRRGDALWDVAARHLGPAATAADIARQWPRWYAANRSVIGPDPGLIHPGDVLVPPS